MINKTIHSTNGLQPDLNLQSALTGNIVLCTLHKVLFACSKRRVKMSWILIHTNNDTTQHKPKEALPCNACYAWHAPLPSTVSMHGYFGSRELWICDQDAPPAIHQDHVQWRPNTIMIKYSLKYSHTSIAKWLFNWKTICHSFVVLKPRMVFNLQHVN